MASSASEAADAENGKPSLSRPFIQQLCACLPMPGAGILNEGVPRWLTFLLSPFGPGTRGFSRLTVALCPRLTAAHTYAQSALPSSCPVGLREACLWPAAGPLLWPDLCAVCGRWNFCGQPSPGPHCPLCVTSAQDPGDLRGSKFSPGSWAVTLDTWIPPLLALCAPPCLPLSFLGAEGRRVDTCPLLNYQA